MDTTMKTNPERRCIPLVVRSEDDRGQLEFGVSFSDHNPEEKDYVALKDRPTALKLVELIRACLTNPSG